MSRSKDKGSRVWNGPGPLPWHQGIAEASRWCAECWLPKMEKSMVYPKYSQIFPNCISSHCMSLQWKIWKELKRMMMNDDKPWQFWIIGVVFLDQASCFVQTGCLPARRNPFQRPGGMEKVWSWYRNNDIIWYTNYLKMYDKWVGKLLEYYLEHPCLHPFTNYFAVHRKVTCLNLRRSFWGPHCTWQHFFGKNMIAW
jgi:hypothetical protein